MKRSNLLIVILAIIIISILLIANFGGITDNDNPIRPGLNIRLEIFENDISKQETIDFGNYQFSDNETIFQMRSISINDSEMDLLFVRKSDYTPTYTGSPIDYDNIFSSDENEFTVDYYQVFTIKEEQIVSLENTGIRIKLLDTNSSIL